MKTRRLTVIGLVAVWSWASLAPVVAQDSAPRLSVADRLEEAILLQEGKADHAGAIELYRDILEEESLVRSIAAEAQFRLAESLLAQGNRFQAEQAFKRLTEEFSEEQFWVDAARSYLPQELDPQMTPWKSGERLLYEYVLPTGNVVGYSTSVLYEFEWEGRPLWRKEHRRMAGGFGMISVEFDPTTFESVYSGFSSGGTGRVDCWFGEGARSAKVDYRRQGNTREFSFPVKHYDNEQATELIRQLPVEVGYRTTMNIFVNFTGGTMGVACEIVDILEMDTLWGKQECYKLELDLGMSKQYFYITNDEKRVLVKMEAGGVDINLVRYDTYEEGRIRRYANERYGFSVEHEDEWVLFEDPENGGSSVEEVNFIAPGGLAGAEIYANLNSKLSQDRQGGALALAEHRRERLAKEKNTIEVSDVSTLTINGLDAALLEAKGKGHEGGVERTALFYIKGAERYYRLKLKAAESDWDLLYDEFVQMAHSFVEG